MVHLIREFFKFFIEFAQRSKTRPPAFFRKIQYACGALILIIIAGIFLKWDVPYLNEFLNVETIMVLLAAAGLSQTPNIDPVKKNADDDGGDGEGAGGSSNPGGPRTP